MGRKISLEKQLANEGKNLKTVLQELTAQGLCATAIAFKFDLSPPTIRQYAKKYGIKLKNKIPDRSFKNFW